MKLKETVKVQGITPEMIVGTMVANAAYKAFGYDPVWTSAVDSKHSLKSKHNSGNAVDYRVKHVPREKWELIEQRIKERLTRDYDVVLESDHIHIEYDPERPDGI